MQPKELEALLWLSHQIGKDEELVQHGGGNTSLKDERYLLIKASGGDLKTATLSSFVLLERNALSLLLQKEQMSDSQMMAFFQKAKTNPKAPNPSVETPLHAFLPAKYVAHTHDFVSQALSDAKNGKALLKEAKLDGLYYLPYARPGFPLAKKVMHLKLDWRRFFGLILEHHGLVIWADSARECWERLRETVKGLGKLLAEKTRGIHLPKVKTKKISPEAKKALLLEVFPFLRGAMNVPERAFFYWKLDDPVMENFLLLKNLKTLSRKGVATPEHLLRASLPLVIESFKDREDLLAQLRSQLRSYRRAYEAYFSRHQRGQKMLAPYPKVFLIRGLGVLTCFSSPQQAEVAYRCYRHTARVLEAAEKLGGFRFLTEKERYEMEYWELELAKLNKQKGWLDGKVAVITGGAGGIGRAIVRIFKENGSEVVVLDRVKKETGTVFYLADVTRFPQVEKVIKDIVLRYGGVDILVLNAGVCLSKPVEEYSCEEVKRHFDVHVMGAFNLVKATVPFFKRQKKGVVLFNVSKAAVAPAKNNWPYCASKAAVLHMARCLALELGSYGIRVNAIHADFVDTPLFRSLLKSRARAQNQPVEKLWKAYRKRNFLQQGPIPAEKVAQAFLFLASEQACYTSGAVLTVDGGLADALLR